MRRHCWSVGASKSFIAEGVGSNESTPSASRSIGPPLSAEQSVTNDLIPMGLSPQVFALTDGYVGENFHLWIDEDIA